MKSLQVASLLSAVYATTVFADVTLPISPNCGTLNGSVADVNSGLKTSISDYDMIVSYGDEYSAASLGNGTSNGQVFLQQLALANNVTFKSFASPGALVFGPLYETPGNEPPADPFVDFQNQTLSSMHTVAGQDTTKVLFTVFFGAADFNKSDGFTTVDPQLIAGNLINGIQGLASSPIFAKDLLVIDNYGRGTNTTEGETYKATVFSNLGAIAPSSGINVGFVDFAPLWNSVLASPDTAGYTSVGPCFIDNTTCDDPATTFYWTDGVPTNVTYSIMAEYVTDVLSTC